VYVPVRRRERMPGPLGAGVRDQHHHCHLRVAADSRNAARQSSVVAPVQSGLAAGQLR
jgi:hypothetical protein